MSTRQRPVMARPTYRDDMAPETTTHNPQTAQEARQCVYQQALPVWYRNLTVHDLPARQTRAVIDWCQTDRPLLWLGGESFRGKTATAWLVAVRYAVDTGKTWAVVDTEAYLEASRGIQTPTEAALIAKAHTADVLVLDEWPRKLNEGKDIDYLRRLLNNRSGRKTVITANGAPGVATTMQNHTDPAIADAARALHNRLTNKRPDGTKGAGDYFPYPATLPQL